MISIPKVVHRVWFGTDPIPENYESWWQGWQRQWPEHAFLTWTDAEIPRLPRVAGKIAEARNFAEKSDIARYEIVRQFGGVYLDCDVMPLYHADFTEMGADLVRNICQREKYTDRDGVLRENAGCGNEFFAATPNHPVLEEIVERILLTEFPQDSDTVDTVQRTGPFLWGDIAKDHGLELCEGAISPYFYEEPFSVIYERNLDHAFGIHVWGNSWIPHEFQKYKLERLLAYGDIRAIEKLLPKTNVTQMEYDRHIRQICAVRDARHNITQVLTNSPHLSNAILGPVNREPFLPFKFAHYLQAARKRYGDGDFRVWHLGACHGVTARELRPILVNYDPETLLVDEDGDALARLRSGYARNRNMRCLTGRIASPDDLATSPLPDILVLSTNQGNLQLLDGVARADPQPRLIVISKDGMSEHQKKTLYTRIPSFRLVEFDHYFCAYRKDWFFYYSAFLFTDHGIPGIFAKLAETVFSTGRPTAPRSNKA